MHKFSVQEFFGGVNLNCRIKKWQTETATGTQTKIKN